MGRSPDSPVGSPQFGFFRDRTHLFAAMPDPASTQLRPWARASLGAGSVDEDIATRHASSDDFGGAGWCRAAPLVGSAVRASAWRFRFRISSAAAERSSHHYDPRGS